jgi:hypothetical protein
MNNWKECSRLIFIITGLLLTFIIGSVCADETNSCTTACTDNLKECRKQADKTTNLEAHPIITDSSVIRAYRNGQGGPLISNNDLPNSQNDEIEKRRAERYEVCAKENNNCVQLCSPEHAPFKNSVIFK